MLFTPPDLKKETICSIYHTNYLPKKLDDFIFLLTLPPSFLPPILSNLNKSLSVEEINT